MQKYMFHTFIYLQGSQTNSYQYTSSVSFTPLFTYKVLKHPMQDRNNERVSHLYLLTRFSNKTACNS